jgi:tetratricopeptide (TPR) repeat protein
MTRHSRKKENPTPGLTGLPSGDANIAKSAAEFRARRQLRHSKLTAAADLLDQNRAESAQTLLYRYLEKYPSDTSALNLMGEIAFKLGQNAKAEKLLARCVALAPDFALARFNYARTLYNLNKLPSALAQLDELLKADQHNFLALDLKSVVLVVMGRHPDAILCRRQPVEDHPGAPEEWIKYANLLQSLGQREQCIAALRKAIELRPSGGNAYWALADLKSFLFSDDEIGAIHDQLLRTDLSRDDRVYFHFALGKAFSDKKDFAKSFENYARGNALKRLGIEYDPDNLTRDVARSKSAFTPEFFRSRKGCGWGSRDPIFIIGMQRAGSTLIEQILASHSAIEATAELPDIPLIGEQIALEYGSRYPEVLVEIDPAVFKQLGQRYLESTVFRRTLGRPFFVDKMPYNFMHVSLIHLMLTDAKIIDVRRHPLGCCVSNFSMHFEVGPLFAYRMNELGRAYSDYVELMAHMDTVLPGYIHRVLYEDLVKQPEAEIRCLLEYLGLPFEEACLRFHENTRTMSSVSAEQVRKPISGGASEYWRNYEPWLASLKAALGPVLGAYPDVPAFSS